MFDFNLQRFGGGGTTVQTAPAQAAQVTPMSPEQRRTIQLQNQYLEATAPVLQNLVQKGSAALNAYSPPDFSQYYQQGLKTTLDAGNMTKQLASGQLSPEYQKNMEYQVGQALQPFQQQFNSLGNRGVINSSLGKVWANSMADTAQKAANASFNQNLATASGLTNQYGQSATAPLAYQSNYYNTVTQPAKDYLTLGTATYQPTGQAANTAYQWQAGLSAPAKQAEYSYIQKQDPFGSILGSVAGAAVGRMKPW